MTLPPISAELKFDPPGPGSWLLDSVHVARPFSRFQAEIHPRNLAAGFRETARRYGLLLDTLDWRMVNGFAYFAVAPVADEEVPSRFGAAEAAFEGKLWRDDMARWEHETKPLAIRSHMALQAVDPTTLDRKALLDHLGRCRDHQARMIRQHHAFNAPAMVPVGDLIAHVREWTDRPLGEVLALLRGTAPESAGSFPELDRLTAAIHESPTARALVESAADPGPTVQALLSAAGDVGASARAYLDIVGYRLLDTFDPAEPFALELPEVLLNGLRQAVTAGAPASSKASFEEEERVRGFIPAAKRDAFDELLVEARLTSRLRDERGLYSEVWAGGITRRAILAAGARLAKEGRLADPRHLAEADYDEMRALIEGLAGPSAAVLSERALFRASRHVREAPPFLGDPPQPPPAGRAAAVPRSDDACDGSCDRRALRSRGDGKRGHGRARDRGKPRRVHGHCTTDRQSGRVRPAAARRRSRHGNDHRVVQYCASHARRNRHRLRRGTLARCNRQPRIRHPQRRRLPRRHCPHRRRSDGARGRDRGRSFAVAMTA